MARARDELVSGARDRVQRWVGIASIGPVHRHEVPAAIGCLQQQLQPPLSAGVPARRRRPRAPALRRRARPALISTRTPASSPNSTLASAKLTPAAASRTIRVVAGDSEMSCRAQCPVARTHVGAAGVAMVVVGAFDRHWPQHGRQRLRAAAGVARRLSAGARRGWAPVVGPVLVQPALHGTGGDAERFAVGGPLDGLEVQRVGRTRRAYERRRTRLRVSDRTGPPLGWVHCQCALPHPAEALGQRPRTHLADRRQLAAKLRVAPLPGRRSVRRGMIEIPPAFACVRDFLYSSCLDFSITWVVGVFGFRRRRLARRRVAGVVATWPTG